MSKSLFNIFRNNNNIAETLLELNRRNTEPGISHKITERIKIKERDDEFEFNIDSENIFDENPAPILKNFDFLDHIGITGKNIKKEKHNPLPYESLNKKFVQKILKLKKPKTRNIKNKLDMSDQNKSEKNVRKSIIFIEQNTSRGSHYNTNDNIKISQNLSSDNSNNFKSVESHQKFTSNSTKSNNNYHENSFKSIILDKEKNERTHSKFKSNSSNYTNCSPEDEFSLCTYDNNQHLVKNFLLNDAQIESLEDKSKKKLKIKKKKILSSNFNRGYTSSINDKIILSDLVSDDNELNGDRIKNERKKIVYPTFKTAKRPKYPERNLFYTKNLIDEPHEKEIDFLKSSQDNSSKTKTSSKFKDTADEFSSSSPKVENFFDYVKSLEKIVKFECKRGPKATFRKKSIRKICINGINLEKFSKEGIRRGFVKNIKNVRNVKNIGKSNFRYGDNIISV